MFRSSLLVVLALSTSGLLACGDNIDSSGPPILESPTLFAATTQGEAIEIDASATDLAGRSLTYTASQPSHGTVSGSGPKFSYTPEAGFFGVDTLTITISNGEQTTTVTVTITVTAHNSTPVTSDGVVYVAQNGGGAIALTAIDSDSASLTYTIVATPQHGTLSGDAPYLTYTPEPGYTGDDDFTYEASDGLATSNVSTISITVTVCGDGTKTPNEQCDDGNQQEEDGCNTSCEVERCGDGVVQLALGETCDDGNTTDGDGCGATCAAEPAVDVLPITVSAVSGCTTEPSNATHHVAADTADIYGVMICGGVGYVVVSHDHGNTYSAPYAVNQLPPGQPIGAVQIGTSIGVAGIAYVGYVLGNGDVELIKTTDHGATWSAPQQIGVTADIDVGFSLISWKHDVYLAIVTGQVGLAPTPSRKITVYRNHADGSGAFSSTELPVTSYQNFDLLYDPTIYVMVLAVDDDLFGLRVSGDKGETWSSTFPVSGAEASGDWAVGGAHLYASGIDAGAITNSSTLYFYQPDFTVTTAAGLPVVTTFRSRALAANVVGDAFVASQLDGGGIQLDRKQADFGVLDPARTISATGTFPGVTDLRGNRGAAVIYTDNGAVLIGVQAYVPECPPHTPC